MTGIAHLKIDLDGFNGSDSPPLGAWTTRVLLDPQVDVTDPAADKVYVGRVSVSLGRDGRPTTANGAAVDPTIGVPLLAGVVYAVTSTALRTTGTIGPLTEGQTYNLADAWVPGAPLTPDQAAILTARIVALEATPPGITDHGALTGLGDDDHPIYLTTGRGDARYVQGSDSRLSDARTPTAHTHGIADLTATGTPSATTYLRGDGTWATPSGGARTIRDFLKPVQIDSDAATLAQVDDPASFIASPGSVVWDNFAAIGYPAGRPVPVTPGTPHNPGARFQPTGGDNPQSLPFSFYANGKIGIHVTLWADTDIWVSIDGKPISADPFIIKVADTATYQPFVTIDTGNPDAQFVRYDITLGWGANLIQIINEPGTLMTPGEAFTFRLGLTGDSYADSGIGPYYGGPAQTLRQLTGVNVIPLGQGSTGYTNDGSSSGDLTKEVFGGPNRLAAIAGAELDALIVVGSVNDGGSTPAATKAAALAFYAAVSPLPVIVVGVEPLYNAADPTYAGWDALNDALIEAADEAPNVIGFVDWRGEDWLTGTGSQSNIQYDGNQDWAIGDVAGTDTIHPSHAGWKLLLIPRLIEAIAPMKI